MTENEKKSEVKAANSDSKKPEKPKFTSRRRLTEGVDPSKINKKENG